MSSAFTLQHGENSLYRLQKPTPRAQQRKTKPKAGVGGFMNTCPRRKCRLIGVLDSVSMQSNTEYFLCTRSIYPKVPASSCGREVSAALYFLSGTHTCQALRDLLSPILVLHRKGAGLLANQ